MAVVMRCPIGFVAVLGETEGERGGERERQEFPDLTLCSDKIAILQPS